MGEPTGRHVFCSNWAHFGNNAPSSDINRTDTLRIIQKKCATSRYFAAALSLLLTLSVTFSACKPTAESGPSVDESAPVAAAPEEEPILRCGNDGRLRAEIYGAIAARLYWNKNELECSGMPRPDGQGARLRFAGSADDDARHIAIIIAIPDLARDATGDEFRSNVTIIEEGNGRFFSTPDLGNCLTDISSSVPVGDSGDRYSIGGVLYCVSPLPEVNGKSSTSIPELHFSGLIDWGAS